MITIDKETIAILSAILGSWISLKVTVGVIKDRQATMEKDIDAIAEYIGTPRALARKNKKKEKENANGKS